MLNYAPDELRRPPTPRVQQWTVVLGRLLAVVSWQRATDDGVRSITVNVAWTWRDG